MPADFSPYINLTVFDQQPGDIYLEAIELARLTLPEFDLRIGTPEDAIFQAASYISSLNIAALNRLPNRLMEGIMSILGLTKQPAISSEIDMLITLDSYSGGMVPQGTLLSYQTTIEDQLQDYIFSTNTELLIDEVINPGPGDDYPSASVSATCLTPGVIPPISTPGVAFSVISAGTNILSAESFANFANGINQDDDNIYLARCVTYLRSLTSSLTTASQLDAHTLSNYPETIGRVKSYDLTNGDPDLGDITANRVYSVDKTYATSALGTIRTTENHLFVVGDTVTLSDCGGYFNDENYVVTATGEKLVSFVKIGAGSASATVTGTAEAGPDVAGYVTVFGYGLNTYLTSSEKSLLLSELSSESVAGLTFNVLSPTLVTLSMTGDVVLDSRFNQSLLQETIENALVDYLSPQVFPYTEGRVRKTKLISLIMNIPGVIYVDNLSISGTGSGWLPQYGDDILFLNKGTLPIISAEDVGFTYTSYEA